VDVQHLAGPGGPGKPSQQSLLLCQRHVLALTPAVAPESDSQMNHITRRYCLGHSKSFDSIATEPVSHGTLYWIRERLAQDHLSPTPNQRIATAASAVMFS
jgi:hypothetical protein